MMSTKRKSLVLDDGYGGGTGSEGIGGVLGSSQREQKMRKMTQQCLSLQHPDTINSDEDDGFSFPSDSESGSGSSSSSDSDSSDEDSSQAPKPAQRPVAQNEKKKASKRPPPLSVYELREKQMILAAQMAAKESQAGRSLDSDSSDDESFAAPKPAPSPQKENKVESLSVYQMRERQMILAAMIVYMLSGF